MSSRVVSYVECKNDIFDLKKIGVKEVIICTSRLSRFSKLSIIESINLANLCLENDLNPVLEWDILMTESEFSSIKTVIEEIDLGIFSAIRVRDPGAVEYIFTCFPKIKIQLLLEYGNHNLKGINEWIKYISTSLDRVILSVEISKEFLKVYLREIDIPVEVMGIGRIPLFYSPRSLLSHAFDEDPGLRDKVYKASSEESPHRGFDVIENMHGTMMFNTKDYGPIYEWNELFEMGVSFIRIDFRHIDNKEVKNQLFSLVKKILSSKLGELRKKYSILLKELYPRPLIKGFYQVNKSNVLFKKLKNSRTKRYDQSYLGEVVEVNKGIHIGVYIKSGALTLDDEIKLITPDGKTKYVTAKAIMNSRSEKIDIAKSGELAFIKHLGGISVKTQVYKEDKNKL